MHKILAELEALSEKLAHEALVAHYTVLFRKPWEDYIEKMKVMEESIKLVAFHTRETVSEAEGCVRYTDQTVYHTLEAMQEGPSMDGVVSYY